MKQNEKDEVKEIVAEAMKEEKEKAENAIKKEKKSKKKIIIISSIIGAVLLLAAVLLYFLFILKPTYKVTLKNGGGKILKEIVIEDNIVKEMPEITPPEGKKLVTWINKKQEAVRPGIELNDDDEWEPIFRGDGETVTLHFSSGTDEVIPDIVIPKGSEVILPAPPKAYKDWKFLFWVYHDDYVVLLGTKIYQDTNIEAYWWKAESGNTEEVTISYDTGTDEKLDSVTVVKGSHYVFKTPTKQKDNMKFKGWLDESGNLLTADSIVEKDITLKAKWVVPYTCPENCTPNEDGKTCTKTTIVAPSKQTVCPATEWTNDYGQTYCIDLNTKEYDRQCASAEPFGTSEVDYTYQDGYDQYGPIIKIACVKKVDYVEQNTCPEGYDRDGDNCKLVETINCTQN